MPFKVTASHPDEDGAVNFTVQAIDAQGNDIPGVVVTKRMNVKRADWQLKLKEAVAPELRKKYLEYQQKTQLETDFANKANAEIVLQ